MSSLPLKTITHTLDTFYDKHPQWLVVIRWATATGKTGLSLELSQSYDLEVISADSRQFFRGMNIGTDKIPGQSVTWGYYETTQYQVPHYMIDTLDPTETYTAWQWKEKTTALVHDITARGKHPFIVWGTGLYIDTIYKNFPMPESRKDDAFRAEMEALEAQTPWSLHKKLQLVDPEEALLLHPNSTRYIIRALEIHKHTGKPKSFFTQRRKPERPLLMLGLWREKESTNRRINARIKQMYEDWLIQEVQWLLDQWFDPQLQSMQGIGYKQVVQYLTDHHDMDRLDEELKRATHRLAKKQRSWFRRYIADSMNNAYPDYIYHYVEHLD